MNLQTNSKNNPLEVVRVNSKKISCAGESSNAISDSGHPLVYLNMGKSDHIICPYCSKYFTIKENSAVKNPTKNKI